MKHHITKKSVFDDLEFDENEAKNLKIRAMLMREIEIWNQEKRSDTSRSGGDFGDSTAKIK